jgi:uncharacterized protein YkwD
MFQRARLVPDHMFDDTAPVDPDRRAVFGRVLVLGFGAVSLAGCGMGVDLDSSRTTSIDPSKPYVPVNPSKAAATISAYRARSGIAPLAVDNRLVQISTAYARNMASVDQMSHSLSPWGPLDKRLRDGGYPYRTAGENLGVGYRTFEDAFEGWQRSPAHDRGMKDADMTVMGIGSVYDPKTRWKCFWCLMFARPRDESAPGPGPLSATF